MKCVFFKWNNDSDPVVIFKFYYISFKSLIFDEHAHVKYMNMNKNRICRLLVCFSNMFICIKIKYSKILFILVWCDGTTKSVRI